MVITVSSTSSFTREATALETILVVITWELMLGMHLIELPLVHLLIISTSGIVAGICAKVISHDAHSGLSVPPSIASVETDTHIDAIHAHTLRTKAAEKPLVH